MKFAMNTVENGIDFETISTSPSFADGQLEKFDPSALIKGAI